MFLHRISLIVAVSCLHFFVLYWIQREPSYQTHIEKAQDISVQLIAPLPINPSQTLASKAATISKPVLQKKTSHSSIVHTAQHQSSNSSHSIQPPETTTENNSSTQQPAAPVVSTTKSSVYQEPRFNVAHLSNPKPQYPSASKRLQEAGKVLLRVHVDASGTPTHIELRNSSGFTRLDNAAINAVRQWRFIPAKRGDIAIADWVLVPLNFELNS